MELKDHKNRERAYVWSTPADYSDGDTPSEELFAMMFLNNEDTKKWKEAWLAAQSSESSNDENTETKPSEKKEEEKKEETKEKEKTEEKK